MSSISLWVAALVAAGLPVAALALRLLDLRRDMVLLLIYAQVMAYMHVGPAVASAGLASDGMARYVHIAWWTVAVFDLPLIVCSLYLARRWQRSTVAPVMDLRHGRTALFAVGCVLLGLGYLVIAVKNGLLYRRIGHVNLADRQLQMGLVDFAFYRTFIELGVFLILCCLVMLRRAPQAGRTTRRLLTGALGVTVGLYLSFALLNSRLSVLILVCSVFVVYQSTARKRFKVTARGLVTGAALALVALYMVRVVVNIRTAAVQGGPLFSLEALSPLGRPNVQSVSDPTAMRLNGVDAIAMIQPGMESFGAAKGTAWIVPFVLSLDPIVRTEQTVTLKRLAMTNAKSYLILRYTGLDLIDYYSCELTDVYGNFGYVGFFGAALLLSVLVAFVGTTLVGSASPARLVIAVFVLSRILPFEQEFATLLFAWIKLAPVVGVLLWLNPLRRPAPARPAPLAAPAAGGGELRLAGA